MYNEGAAMVSCHSTMVGLLKGGIDENEMNLLTLMIHEYVFYEMPP